MPYQCYKGHTYRFTNVCVLFIYSSAATSSYHSTNMVAPYYSGGVSFSLIHVVGSGYGPANNKPVVGHLTDVSEALPLNYHSNTFLSGQRSLGLRPQEKNGKVQGQQQVMRSAPRGHQAGGRPKLVSAIHLRRASISNINEKGEDSHKRNLYLIRRFRIRDRRIHFDVTPVQHDIPRSARSLSQKRKKELVMETIIN